MYTDVIIYLKILVSQAQGHNVMWFQHWQSYIELRGSSEPPQFLIIHSNYYVFIMVNPLKSKQCTTFAPATSLFPGCVV